MLQVLLAATAAAESGILAKRFIISNEPVETRTWFYCFLNFQVKTCLWKHAFSNGMLHLDGDNRPNNGRLIWHIERGDYALV